jgi:hypothetical protein
MEMEDLRLIGRIGVSRRSGIIVAGGLPLWPVRWIV